MKILTINWTYKYGSTGKLICDIENELPQCEFYHCYEYDTIGGAENACCLTDCFWSRVHNRTSRLKGLQYQNGFAPTNRLIHKIEEYRPDIIHIHCPNGNTLNLYRLLGYIKQHRIPTVITNHAEFFYTGNCAYAHDCTQYMTGCRGCPRFREATRSLFWNRAPLAWEKMREAFRGFGSLHMVCVSPWQEKRLKESVICGGLPCSVIGNGIDTAVFRPSERGAAAQEKIIILQVTAHFSDDPEDIKGGKYLIDLAEQLGGAYEIRVAGAVYLSQEARLPDNITLLGNISDQNRLADEYRNADLTVLTSRRETFGMACAESLCCGTPVVGFACGGTESIALPEYTGFCEFGNVEALREEVLGMGSRKRTMSAQEADMMARLAAETYAKRTMADAYDKLYQELIESAEGRTGGNDGN